MLRLTIIFSLCLSGCALIRSDRRARVVGEVDWPVSGLRAIVGSQVPVGHKSISPNGREFVSLYFILQKDGFRPGDDADDRYFVKYTILGDRRPYDVEILVTHERRVLKGIQFVYAKVGFDAKMAEVLAERLRRELSKRREDRNVVDDFRVY